jgi:ABC-type multidrug transport system ATPase subunit
MTACHPSWHPISHPRLLLLDEPTLGLAPLIVKQIFATLRKLNQDGMTILLIEQNANQALKLSEYSYILENGRIALEGKSTVLSADKTIADHVNSTVCRPTRHLSLGAGPAFFIFKSQRKFQLHFPVLLKMRHGDRQQRYGVIDERRTNELLGDFGKDSGR